MLLAISGTTTDQTAPSNQGLHDNLFCRFKQHERKYVDDSILNIGPKYSSIHCVSRSFCYILPGSMQIFILLFELIKLYLIQQLYGVPIFSVTMVCPSFKGRELPLHDNFICVFFNLYILPATLRRNN